jgi:hypothetical protein
MGLSMSVCLSVFITFLLGGRQPPLPGSLLSNHGNSGPPLEHNYITAEIKVIVGTHELMTVQQ